ncbi:hypothetical protein KY285_021259 [Solanum tuberosum]|nr:hypothetical protein KY285_021259 [Solanum tuberosum]
MEVVEVTGTKPIQLVRAISNQDRIKVKRKTLEAVLQECQRALELLSTTGSVEDDTDESNSSSDVDRDALDDSGQGSSTPSADVETDELRDLLKSRVQCSDFLQKLENAQASVPQNLAEEGSSWDMINENDLWEGGDPELDGEDYVLVRQEDIVDGIACFMAAYLLSLKQTKDLTPNQLQDVGLRKVTLDFLHSSQQDILFEKEERKAPKGMGWKQSYLQCSILGGYSYWDIPKPSYSKSCINSILDFLPCNIKALISSSSGLAEIPRVRLHVVTFACALRIRLLVL